MPKTLDKTILRQFTGSERFYRHALVPKVIFTEGAKYVADAAGAYWLLDEIAFAQITERAVAAEEFQVWTLKVSNDHTALLTCEDGDFGPVFEKRLAFTDFPGDGIVLWYANGTIYLPTEH